MLASLGTVFLAGNVAATPQAAPPQAKPANPFQAQAGQLGVRKCANLFSALGQTVALGSDYSGQVQAEKAAPDAHGVVGVVGMTYKTAAYNSQAAGVVVATPVGTKCEGQLVRVAPFQRACKDVLSLLPAGSTAAGSLSGVPLYNLGGNQGQAMLIASGPACVVVTVARGADVG
ncbi:MAG: hypothetical protein JF600_00005 [Xanthomonadales bacterium]|nr:hypothetical protein [Xanthomonadales bacterium]